METGALLRKLNWFYALELSQVDLYTAQSKRVEDPYMAHLLARVSVIEQQHADNIGAIIKQLGGNPNFAFDILAPRMGKFLGTVAGWGGVDAILRLNLRLEEKAKADYRMTILEIPDRPQIQGIMWSNLVDEDFHATWFENRLRLMKQESPT